MEITASSSLCLIQLSRIGDLLQTVHAVKSLKAHHPTIQLTLVARKRYAEPILYLLQPLFTKIFLLDLLEGGQEKIQLHSLRSYLHNLMTDINQLHFTHCFNLTYSQSSAYLTGLVKADHKKGLIRNNKGELLIPDSWSQFVYGVVMRGAYNPFNLVDIFKAIFELPVTPIPLPVTQKSLSDTAKPHIFIHPFASQSKKRWAPEKWEEVIYTLLTSYKNLTISLMGAKEDQPALNTLLTPRISKYKERIIDRVGKGSLEELDKSLTETTLFIGHDSMGGHLASLKGIDTLTISLGPVRPSETTPYGHDQINLAPTTACFPCILESSCEEHACHQSASPKLVSTLIGYAIENKIASYEQLMQDISFLHLSSVDILHTDLSTGIMQIRYGAGHIPTTQTIFNEYYFVLWNFMLGQREVKATSPVISPKLIPALEDYLQGIKKCYELNYFAQESCQKILEQLTTTAPNNKTIQDNIKKMQEIDSLFSLLKKPYPLLSPLIDYFYVGRANLVGEQILSLVTQSLINYQEFCCGLQIIQEFIEKGLDQTKPKEVSKQSSLTKEMQRDN